MRVLAAFSVLEAKSHINERAQAANDDPRFSVRSRDGLPRMSFDPAVEGDAMSPMPNRWFALLVGLCLALAACAGPLGTARVDPKAVLGNLGRSAVATGEPSIPTRNVLFEQGLFEAVDARPEAAIAELHQAMVASHGDQDLLFALAELSFLHGQTATKADYSLAAAVYAYAFLFPEDAGDPAPGRFDPRVRIAADLYNWALTRAFTSTDASEVVPRGGAFTLPFGRIDVAFDPAALRAGDRELYRLIPVAELDIYGLQMRYRWPGLGAPLAASTRPIDASRPGRDMVAPRLQVPVTALLRIPDARRALVQNRPLTGTLEMHLAWDAESVSIAGEQVPLENEPSAALALTFTGVPVMELETLGLLGRLSGILRDRPPLVSATPYRPGLIPVVFVHGTASSTVRWMEMYNRLARRPRDPQPLPVLVLPVRLGRPDRAVGAPPARGADRGRRAARPRGAGSGPASDDPDRAQSGGAPGQDAGHPQRGSALERGQPQAAGGAAAVATRSAICSAAGCSSSRRPR